MCISPYEQCQRPSVAWNSWLMILWIVTFRGDSLLSWESISGFSIWNENDIWVYSLKTTRFNRSVVFRYGFSKAEIISINANLKRELNTTNSPTHLQFEKSKNKRPNHENHSPTRPCSHFLEKTTGGSLIFGSPLSTSTLLSLS